MGFVAKMRESGGDDAGGSVAVVRRSLWKI